MGFKILRNFENVVPYMQSRFSQVVGNGVKSGEVSNCPERCRWSLRSSSFRSGFARSGIGWVLELVLLIWQWTDRTVHRDHKHCLFFEGSERFYRTIRGLDVLLWWVNHENQQGEQKLIQVVGDHKKRVPDACSLKQAKTISCRWLTTDSLQTINMKQSSSSILRYKI